ncbi:hypothetical protein A143_20555 [Vibrio splendidus ZS-139]|nr:hypothetical protein A143_20555 [Vibrio splendidus ZS-139]
MAAYLIELKLACLRSIVKVRAGLLNKVVVGNYEADNKKADTKYRPNRNLWSNAKTLNINLSLNYKPKLRT